MDLLVLVLLLALLATAPALVVVALVSAARAPASAWSAVGRSRTNTLLLILFTGIVGAGYYMGAIRPHLAEATSPPEYDGGWAEEPQYGTSKCRR